MIYFPAGTYVISAKLDITPGTVLMGGGPDLSVIDGRSGPTGGGDGILDCRGSTVTLPALSGAITVGDGIIDFSASVASDLEYGDWVRFNDTTANSMDTDSSTDGFTCMVESAEGSTLYPASPCHRTLPAARTSGPLSNVTAKKLDARGLVVRDLRVIGQGFDLASDGGSSSGIGINVQEFANVRIDNVEVLGAGTAGIRLEMSANVTITGGRSTVHTGDWSGLRSTVCTTGVRPTST